MLRKLHRSYDVPKSFDSTFDEGIRGLESALARVPGDRYPLRANDDAAPALAKLRDALYGLENWLYANWQSARRRSASASFSVLRRSAAATSPCAASSPTR